MNRHIVQHGSFLGRYIQGSRVPVYVETNVLPDDVPAVSVYSDTGLVVTKKVPATSTPSLFCLPLFLDQSFPEGNYRVVTSYSVSGVLSAYVDNFQVVSGGDPGGAILSMQYYDRPEARFLLVQLESRLVQGKNPGF